MPRTTDTTDTCDLIAKLEELIRHPHTPAHEKDAARRRLARVKAKMAQNGTPPPPRDPTPPPNPPKPPPRDATPPPPPPEPDPEPDPEPTAPWTPAEPPAYIPGDTPPDWFLWL